MRYRRRRVAAILLGLATVALVGNPNSIGAAATLSLSDPWPRMDCRDGAITRAEPDATRMLLTIEGWLGCATEPVAGWTRKFFVFARYQSIREHGRFRFWGLYGLSAPTKFSMTREVDEYIGDFAICIATDYDVRVACIHVTRPVGGPITAVQPIPPDDPIVNKTIPPLAPIPSTHVPMCGTCW
jgi:hypothetical protein